KWPRRVRISAPQLRPPLRLQPRIEGARIDRTDNITADTLPILHNEAALRREGNIGCGIDMADKARIGMERGCVLPIRARFKGDPIDRFQIVCPRMPDFRNHLHSPRSRPNSANPERKALPRRFLPFNYIEGSSLRSR